MEGLLKIPVKKGGSKKLMLELIRPLISEPTSVEIRILAEMLEQKLYVLTKDNRARLRELLNIEKLTFNNYLQRLKNKDLILLRDKKLIINPMLISITNNNTLNIEVNESA